MIIRKYGIELHRVSFDDIELIREMRNRSDIRSHMFFRDHISKEKQKEWFASINNIYNYYFLIKQNEKKIGLIYGKDHDFTKSENEGGIFIWDHNAIGLGAATKASICFMEATFNFFMTERVYARVLPENHSAIAYNQALGYISCPEKGDYYMVLTKDVFLKKIARLRKIADHGKGEPPLSIKDAEIPDFSSVKDLYLNLPSAIQEKLGPLLKK